MDNVQRSLNALKAPRGLLTPLLAAQETRLRTLLDAQGKAMKSNPSTW